MIDLPPPEKPPAFHQILLKTYKKPIFSAIKIKKKQKRYTYDTLPGSSKEDREKIFELFESLGSHGKISLLFHHQSRLRKLGEEIKHVHPLKLLGCLFSRADMRRYMENIYEDFFKWSNFFEGFEASVKTEIIKKNLKIYLNGFAAEVNIPPNKLKPFFDSDDWRGLIKYLIYYQYQPSS